MPVLIKNKRPVATVIARFNCGCGFKTYEPTKAQEHVLATGHKVTLSGCIEPLVVRPLNEEEEERKVNEKSDSQ